MKKSVLSRMIIAVAVLTLIATSSIFAPLSAQEIDEDEIKSLSSTLDTVQFTNYSGTHYVIESASAIRGIGVELGKEIAEDISQSKIIHEGQKYSVVHALSNENLLSADILILSQDAGVDHITNLRRIISGFLSSAYGYNDDDADTISFFITVYNAVYRGEIQYFSEKYDINVVENLSKEKVGLSTNWEDWAGNTQIVIPLKNLSFLPSIDTSPITDENVIESLRNTDDMGIEEREKMADLKEQEMKDADKNAKESQKEATKLRNEGDEEQAKKSAERASEMQKFADKTRNEIQGERSKIAKDSENLASKSDEIPKIVKSETGLFGPDKKGLYHLAKLDSETGKTIFSSQMKQIRSKAVFEVTNITITSDENKDENKTYAKMYLAICGENTGKSAVKLCLIDEENLAIQKESISILSPDSDIVPYGEDYLVILKEGKSYFLALFDKNLEMKAKSDSQVRSATPINLTEMGILVTDEKGIPIVLAPKNLHLIYN